MVEWKRNWEPSGSLSFFLPYGKTLRTYITFGMNLSSVKGKGK